MDELTGLSATLAVLSAMITPIVLISACGSLTISTSNRLSRAIDRSRKLSDELEKFVQDSKERLLGEERQALLFEQLHYFTKRIHLLHRALACLYVALATFVGTSVAIGIVEIFNERYSWLPLILAMIGAGLLFYTCILLIRETYLARKAILSETEFAWKLAQELVPKDLASKHQEQQSLLDRFRRAKFL